MSQNSHKFNCQRELSKKRGFAHSVVASCTYPRYQHSSLSSPVFVFFFFLQYRTTQSPDTFLELSYVAVLPLALQYPSCLCKGKLLRKPRERGTTCAPRQENKAAPQHFFTRVERKGRWPGEAEQKSSSPSWLPTWTSLLCEREGYCLHRCDCYKWVSGVDNILLTCCKQRRKFVADSCRLANINKNVRSIWKEKSLRCLELHKK